MRRIVFIVFSVLAVFFASCSSKDMDPIAQNSRVRFSIPATMPELEDTPETKAQSEYVVRLKWQTTDEISVINLTTSTILGGSLVSTSNGTKTTFTGTLVGNVSENDDLLFLYPAKGNTVPEPFDKVEIDFSHQAGSTSDGVVLAAYTTGKAAAVDGSFSVSTATNTFSFLMSYNYISMSNLPKAAEISGIRIKGVPSKLDVSWSAEDNSIKTDAVVEEDSFIELTASMSTGSNGDRPVFVAIPAITSSSSLDKQISVSFTNEESQEEEIYSALLPSAYAPKMAKNYRMVISSFQMDGLGSKSISFSFLADFPSLELCSDDENDAGSLPNGVVDAWPEGAEISVIDITSGELLSGTLLASGAGETVRFEGTVTGNMEICNDDYFSFVYPPIGNSAPIDLSQSSAEISIFQEQDGSIENLPYILSGDMNPEYPEMVSFSFLSSVGHVNVSEAFPDYSDLCSSSVARNGSGLSEIGSMQIYMPSSILVKCIDGELLLSAGSSNGIFIQKTEQLDEDNTVPFVLSDNSYDFFFSFPGLMNDSGYFSSFMMTMYPITPIDYAEGFAINTYPVSFLDSFGTYYEFTMSGKSIINMDIFIDGDGFGNAEEGDDDTNI